MRHFLLSSLAVFAVLMSNAQVELARVAATTGGDFGAAGNYVKLYTAHPDLSGAAAADSALGDFSNAVTQDGALLYAHVGRSAGHSQGSDMLLVYNLATQQRSDSVTGGISGTQELAVYGDYLIVTRGFGASDNKRLLILDKHDYSEVYSDTTLSEPGAMYVYNDHLYVGYTRADRAELAVYDLNGTPQREGDINLDDTLTSGLNSLFIHDETAYLLHRRFNPDFTVAYDGFTALNLNDSSFAADTSVSADEIFAVNDSKLWLRKNGITTYDIAAGTFTNVSGTQSEAAAFDSISGNFYLQNTDYFSFGEINLFDDQFDTISSAATDYSGSAVQLAYNRLPAFDSMEIVAQSQTEKEMRLVFTEYDRGDFVTISDVTVSGTQLSVLHDDSVITVIYGSTGSWDDTLTVTACDGLGGCIDFEYRIEGEATGVEELSATEHKIYPNPATDVLFVDGLNQNTSFRLIDLTGKEVKRGFTQNRIDVSDLNRGMYLLQVDGGNPQKIMIK